MFWGDGKEGEGWRYERERESRSWRPWHSDGSPTCCGSRATLNSPSELMSHTSCLPVSLFLSYQLFNVLHTSSLFFVFLPLSLLFSLAVSLYLFPVLSSPYFTTLSNLPPSFSPFLSFFLSWRCHTKCHGNAILMWLEGASLFFLKVTPL